MKLTKASLFVGIIGSVIASAVLGMSLNALTGTHLVGWNLPSALGWSCFTGFLIGIGVALNHRIVAVVQSRDATAGDAGISGALSLVALFLVNVLFHWNHGFHIYALALAAAWGAVCGLAFYGSALLSLRRRVR